MIRLVLVALFAASTASAQVTMDEYCGHTASVVSAIQQARLDRVDERDVSSTLLAGTPTWPERYNAAITQLAPWVYQQKRRDLRNADLGDAWTEVCRANWDSFKDTLN